MTLRQKRAVRDTVLNWVKKKVKEIKPLKETLKKYKPEYNYHLVFDELWSFIKRKSNKIRIWIAKCIETKQILAYHIGGGKEKDCIDFFKKIPIEYSFCHSFSDKNSVYESVFGNTFHRCVEKKTGITNSIEAFNNLLRQNLSRLIRKSCTLTKIKRNVRKSKAIFISDYNLRILNEIKE